MFKQNGVLNINKPSGITSHDVVMLVRKAFNTKKVGHTGTLDPLATGVLPVCINNATKISQFLISLDKTYKVTMRLGITTDSGDITGKIISQKNCYNLTKKEIRHTILSFKGEIWQTPPMFSAIKKNGVPLYKLARRGININREPRLVSIYDMKLMKSSAPDINFSVKCSKGTYVRSLVSDIGEKLGVGATITKLERIESGIFKLKNSVKPTELNKIKVGAKAFVSCNKALNNIPAVLVNNSCVEKIRNCGLFKNDARIFFEAGRYYKIIDKTKALIAIAIGENGGLKIARVIQP